MYKLVHKSGSIHMTGTKEECIKCRNGMASIYYMDYSLVKFGG